MSQQYNAGSAVVRSGEVQSDGSIWENVTTNPSARGLLLERLNILTQLYILEGGDGDCPDETDLDLVEGNVLQ